MARGAGLMASANPVYAFDLLSRRSRLAKSSNTLNKRHRLCTPPTSPIHSKRQSSPRSMRLHRPSDRYIFTALARARPRGGNRAEPQSLLLSASCRTGVLPPHRREALIRRVRIPRMDYWIWDDMKLGDDIYESVPAYQRALLRNTLRVLRVKTPGLYARARLTIRRLRARSRRSSPTAKWRTDRPRWSRGTGCYCETRPIDSGTSRMLCSVASLLPRAAARWYLPSGAALAARQPRAAGRA